MAIQLEPDLERFAEQQARRTGLRSGDEYVRKLVEADMIRHAPQGPEPEAGGDAYISWKQRVRAEFTTEKKAELRRQLEEAAVTRNDRDLAIAEQWAALDDGWDDADKAA